MTTRVVGSLFSRCAFFASSQRTTTEDLLLPSSSSRRRDRRLVGNRRRRVLRVASSSPSPLSSEHSNEAAEENEEEKLTNETIAGTTKTSRVVDFVAAWDVLSGRLAESSIMRSEDESEANEGNNANASPSREMLLAALALAIPKLQRMPPHSFG